MFTKITFLAGAGIGYVLGARAGRSQYEKIKSFAQEAEVPAPVANVARTAAEKAQSMMGMGESEQKPATDRMPTYTRM